MDFFAKSNPPQITNKSTSFKQIPYKSNISIPTNRETQYISLHLNENQDLLSTKSLITLQESDFSKPFHSKHLPKTFFFRQSLDDQNREILEKRHKLQGINPVNPQIKEKFKKKEVLNVAKSLLIAHQQRIQNLQAANQKILGFGTKDLLRFSRFNDPIMVKNSIIADNTESYAKVQTVFSRKEDKSLVKTKEKDEFLKNNGAKKNKLLEHLEGLQGKTILLKEELGKNSQQQISSRADREKVEKNRKIRITSLKKLNFKRNQLPLSPITQSLRVETSEKA